MKYEQLAKDIVEKVGGRENITSLSHCVTRLRFVLKDESVAKKKEIEKLQGVVTVMRSGGQYQVVVGNHVSDVYNAVLSVGNIEVGSRNDDGESKGNFFGKTIDMITSIFTPILGALAGSGVLRGLLMIFSNFGLISTESGTYQILFATSNSIMYFLPMLLAFTSAKKFGANPAVALTLAGTLIYPDIVALMNEGASINFLGIPVVLMSYSSTVIPIIVAVWILSHIEKFFNKYIHAAARGFLTPMFSLAIVAPLTFLAIGPLGVYAGEGLGMAYTWLFNLNPVIAGALIGALWQVFVIFGLHWGLIPIGWNNLAVYGYNTLNAFSAPSIFAQAGASLGVFLKTKRADVKAISGSAAMTGLFGITEPAVYGVTLKYKKPFIIACIAGAIGGGISGVVGAAAKAPGMPGLLTLPVFAGTGFAGFLIGIIVTYLIAFVGTYLFGYRDADFYSEEDSETEESTEVKVGGGVIYSPVQGNIIELKDVNDPVFSQEIMGKGIAIQPKEGRVVSPINGKIATVFKTKHAIGLVCENGAEILIHIGLDTVQLDGEHFTAHVKEGDTVKVGDLLVEFDIEEIHAAGYETVTPVIVTNTADYRDVLSTIKDLVSEKDELMTVIG